MSLRMSRTQTTQQQRMGRSFVVRSMELYDEHASPVVVFDDFRVSGRPFGPHPHAGVTALSYIFEDSVGSLRNRDSMGHHLVLGPGSICCLQSSAGAMHEEIPAKLGEELHGLQVFVNLSEKNKHNPPQSLWLDGAKVPEWSNARGDRVRVAMGAYQGVASPLQPVEPFDVLDVDLKSEIPLDLAVDHNAVVYVSSGTAAIRAGAEERTLEMGQGLVLSGSGRASLKAVGAARLIIVSGATIPEPVVVGGPFIMTSRAEIDDAGRRFQAGEMGHLSPYAEG